MIQVRKHWGKKFDSVGKVQVYRLPQSTSEEFVILADVHMVRQLELFEEPERAISTQGDTEVGRTSGIFCSASGKIDLRMPNFYEFFAGGGMARAGLGDSWLCAFANDIDEKKGASYKANWGDRDLRIQDIGTLTSTDLPDRADLAWGSFPCQDLSLAGDYRGLEGERSGTFWQFWRLMTELDQEGRGPKVIVLENVCGAITSHEGRDFASIGLALAEGGYRFGALVMDAVHFVPQSRPRLFIVAVRKDAGVANDLLASGPNPLWHPTNLVAAEAKMPEEARSSWVWWRLPPPPVRTSRFGDLIQLEAEGVAWHSPAETKRLLGMMSDLNRKKVEAAKRMQRIVVGALYKRTRVNELGIRTQRAEVRFDDVAGCLRTPVGGSSRQSILVVEGKSVRSRLLSPREAARLMGLPDDYQLPKNYNEAYHLVGDGLAVPVVRFLSAHLLEALVRPALKRRKAAA